MSEGSLTRHEQDHAGASPWSFMQRVRMLFWEWSWTVLCRWTPKPFNAWRLLWFRSFGGRVDGQPFIHPRARIQIPWNVTLHDRATLGDGTNVYSLGPVSIGKGSTIAQEAYLCTGTHDFADGICALVTAPINIGANAFVGARAFVMPGVTLGDGAMLGAMSVATKDVPPWTVCAGNPAKQIGRRKKPPLRVNIVQGAFLPVPAVRGGAVEKVWYVLGRELARSGCEVTHVSRLYGDLPRDEVRDGVRYLRVPGFDACSNITRLKWRDLRYSLRVRRVLPPADITVTNTFWMPLLLKRAHGLAYVHVARFPKGQMGLYRRAGRLQPVSEVVGHAIKQQTPSVAHLVKALANPLPENWLRTDLSPGSLSGTRRVLYAGRIHPEKGIDCLIDAFALLPAPIRAEWTLSVVGPWQESVGGGGDDYLEELKHRAAQAGVQVTWIEPTYDQELLKGLYDQAEIFVYPSRAVTGEAFGLAPVEAMGRGCPPIVSSLQCFRDYLLPGENGLVFSSDSLDPARELADALSQLISAPDLRQRLRQGALRTAALYTPEHIARQYLEDFEALVYC